MSFGYQQYYQQEYHFKKPDKSLEYFKHRFEAHITESKEFRHAVRPDYLSYKDAQFGPYTEHLRSEPCVAVHLPRDKFERLIEQQDYIQRMESDANYGKDLSRKQYEDRMVRESNASVDRAYKNYQMLLELARK